MKAGGLVSFRRAEAEALPLTEAGVRAVIARARRVSAVQLAGLAAVTAGFGWLALGTEGVARFVPGLVAALAAWGVLGAALSLWDHFAASRVLARLAPSELAAEADAKKFWWKYRGVFPMSWDDR